MRDTLSHSPTGLDGPALSAGPADHLAAKDSAGVRLHVGDVVRADYWGQALAGQVCVIYPDVPHYGGYRVQVTAENINGCLVAHLRFTPEQLTIVR